MDLLTEVIPQPSAGERVPIMIEVPLAPELDGPFLVSSSRDFLWVENKFPSGIVRAAVRKFPLWFLYRDALFRIARQSKNREWGSRHPNTQAGLQAAIGHLEEYGLEAVEVFLGSGFDESLVPEDVPYREVTWVPTGWAVVLPQDRSYVGTTVDFGGGRVAFVLHNSSRGVGLAVPAETPLSVLPCPIRSKLPVECESLEDLRSYTEKELLALKGLGPKRVDDLKEILGARGFHLRRVE